MTPLLNTLRPFAGNETASGADSMPKANAMPSIRTNQIRALNDIFRETLLIGGQCILTQGVSSMSEHFIAEAVASVRGFTDFTADNDPYGEHDFGTFKIADTECIWKIDYYDNSLHYGSKDPANGDQTKRVLTIMLAEEY